MTGEVATPCPVLSRQFGLNLWIYCRRPFAGCSDLSFLAGGKNISHANGERWRKREKVIARVFKRFVAQIDDII